VKRGAKKGKVLREKAFLRRVPSGIFHQIPPPILGQGLIIGQYPRDY